jgi:hypothetical protein
MKTRVYMNTRVYMKTRVYMRKTSESLCNIQSSFPEDGHVEKNFFMAR